ncbi:MAG: ABC transporter ATP-binding protein [Actinobacteria bacterium]|nr:ABC transporter ATP-binding protein [Actinomycetota bacterium]
MSENNNIIVAQELTKVYNETTTAVDHLNLKIKEGEIFGLLGPNGAGKSTIILMLLGLTEPTSGNIGVAGFDSTREPLKVKSITGYLPEKVGFYEDMSAYANLAYTAELNRVPYREIPERIDEVLGMVKLVPNKKQLVKTFSKGMKQRLGIADVLVKHPKLVIFDEPTEGLDPKLANQLLQTILDLNREKGITFMLSSHQLNLVQKICPRVGIMSRGKLVGEGSIDDMGRNLFGGGKYRIEIELAKVPDELIANIKKIPKVVSVAVNGQKITVTCNNDLREDVSKIIAHAGIIMTRMDMKQDALEEIYLRYFKEEV